VAFLLLNQFATCNKWVQQPGKPIQKAIEKIFLKNLPPVGYLFLKQV
jgi:hypothetical protein